MENKQLNDDQVKPQKLSEDTLDDVNGAGLFWIDHDDPDVVYYAPSDKKLKQLGLDGIVRETGGFTDHYYDTKRGDDEWKNVGSNDMLKYVERTLGADDPRYQALYSYCQYGR